jgi:hypothetical protein
MIVGAIIGGVAALAICGYFGYRMLFSSGFGSHVATSETPSSTAAPASATNEPPKDSGPASQSSSQDTSSSQTAPATPLDSEAKPVASDTAKATGAGSDASKAGAQDASKMGMAGSPKDSGKGAASKAGTTSPPTPGAATAPADAPKTVAQGTNPAQSAPPDRWRQMKDAMSKCSGETFFKRVACEQAVGLQYCEGYWGRVPQCPSGPPKDHGQ